MQGVIGRIRARLAKAESSAAADAADDPASIVYVLTDPVEEAKPRSLITFLGEPPENIGEILTSVAFACRLRGEYPVVVMSELKPDLIAVSTAPIEFIPTFRHLPSRPDEYERYVQRRWSLMLAKWNFGKQIELNVSFDDFVAAQLAPRRNSPDAYTLASELVKRTGRPHGEDELLDRLRRLECPVRRTSAAPSGGATRRENPPTSPGRRSISGVTFRRFEAAEPRPLAWA